MEPELALQSEQVLPRKPEQHVAPTDLFLRSPGASIQEISNNW